MAEAIKRERDMFDGDLLSSLHEVPSDSQKLKTDDDDKKGTRWTPEQDEALRRAVDKYGQRNWKSIAGEVEGRNHAQCLQRWNKVLKPGLVKGHWSYEEDSILERMVLQGCHSWSEVSVHIPGRTAKQCRERWRNHLDPSINKSPFTPEEDITIQQAFEQLGNRWTQIAELLPGRTEDAVKMRWKALNPNQRTKAGPGRPRLMPGMPTSKTRAAAPPNPDLAAGVHTMMAPPGAPQIQQMYAYPTAYGTPAAMPMGSAMPLDTMPLQYQQQQQHHDMALHQQQHHIGGYADVNGNGNCTASEFPEPSIEPLGNDDRPGEVDSKDAAMLKEFLRSHSSSLLSFGSARGMSSFADMSPDELLASGELDEMLKAVSLANEGGGEGDADGAGAGGPTTSMGSSGVKSQSGYRLTNSFTNARSLARALENMTSSASDKHIFQELIDELRIGGDLAAPSGGGSQAPLPRAPIDPNSFEFMSSSGRNLTHSLEFGQQLDTLTGGQSNYMQRSIDDYDDDEDDDDDDDDFDLMKPIRKGKQF